MQFNEAITRYQSACSTAGNVPFRIDELRSRNASDSGGLGEPCQGIPGTPSLGWLIFGGAKAPQQALAFIAEAGEEHDLLLADVHVDS